MTYQDLAGYSLALNIALAAWIASVRLRVFLRFAVVVVVIAVAAAAAVHHAAGDDQSSPAVVPASARTAAHRRGRPTVISATRPGHHRRVSVPRPRDAESARIEALRARRAAADTSWQREAACAGKPGDAWYPAGKGVQAVEICKTRCPVQLECWDYGLKYEGWGIWGGFQQWQLDRQRTPGLSKLLRRAS